MYEESQSGTDSIFLWVILAAFAGLFICPWVWIYLREPDLQRANLIDYTHATLFAWMPSNRLTTQLYVKQNSRKEQRPLTSDEVVVLKEMEPKPGALPFDLVPEIKKQGWQIVPGNEISYQCSELEKELRTEIYGGKSLWMLYRKPAEWYILFVLCLYGGFAVYRNRVQICDRIESFRRKWQEKQRQKKREQSSAVGYPVCAPKQLPAGLQNILPPLARRPEAAPAKPFAWNPSMWKDD